MNEKKTIAVLGAGYVGLTTAALLAHAGYKVFAVEPNKKRLKVIKQGRSFFFEEGLDPIIKTSLNSGDMVATDSYKEAVPGADFIFSCVGTPDNPDGSSNLMYVFEAAKETIKHIKPGAIYIQKSTVPVGTGEKIEAMFRNSRKKNCYVSNPEFLREGTALFDTLYFDRIVTGGRDNDAVDAVLDVYRSLESNRDQIAGLAGIEKVKIEGAYIGTSRESAELIKVTSNAFLALKISFANSIAKLSDQAGANIREVMSAVGADPRIGKAFLNAGRGYGGGCFPKDVSGLIASGLEHGVDLEIMQAAREVNLSMPGYIVEKMKKVFGGSFQDKQIAVLGLAFKSGTSDVRRSPGITLANMLVDNGAVVYAYDPKAAGEAYPILNSDIKITNSFESTIKDADAILVATDWSEFTDLPIATYAKAGKKGCILVDGMNCFEPSEVRDAGMQYIGVGIS